MNRDSVSAFVTEIQMSKPAPIEPRFVDFEHDITKYDLREGVQVLQTKNTRNSLFSVSYIFDMGTENSKTIEMALNYASYLGDADGSLQDFQEKLFALGCDYSTDSEHDQTHITHIGDSTRILTRASSSWSVTLTTLQPENRKGTKPFVPTPIKALQRQQENP